LFVSISDEALHETKLSSVHKPSVSKHAEHNDEHRDLTGTSLADMHPLLQDRAESFGNSNRSQILSQEEWSNTSSTISPYIQDDDGRDESLRPYYAVWWQFAPVIADRSTLNYNHLTCPEFTAETQSVIQSQRATMSHIYADEHGEAEQDEEHEEHGHEMNRFETFLINLLETFQGGSAHEPFAFLHYPVVEHVDGDASRNVSTVAILSATVYWRDYFMDVLPEDINGVVCVVTNSLNQSFSYRIEGPVATFMGLEDFHEAAYDYLRLEGNFVGLRHDDRARGEQSFAALDEDYISYSIHIYPSAEFEKRYRTSTPYIVSLAMAFLFVLTAMIFKAYDYVIARRQNMVQMKADKSDEIVASLFPHTVRSRILGDDDFDSAKNNTFVSSKYSGSGLDESRVIADFYPEATILCKCVSCSLRINLDPTEPLTPAYYFSHRHQWVYGMVLRARAVSSLHSSRNPLQHLRSHCPKAESIQSRNNWR
jgi:hypothetical protein